MKFYDDEHCSLTVFNRDVFIDDGWEARRRNEPKESLFIKPEFDEPPQPFDRDRTDNLNRAKRKVFDIAYANSSEWKYMVTLTLDGGKVSRYEAKDILTPFQNWLKNCVKRKGLKALLVAEHHKDGGIHFHGLVNESLKLKDSGTVKVNDHKKPIKIATADRLSIPLEERRTVYNCTDWKYGFSTFVEVDDNTHSVCKYITKYVTKDFEKIFGKYYFAVGDLKREVPQQLFDIDFGEFVSGGGEAQTVFISDLPFDGGKVAFFNADRETVLEMCENLKKGA